MYPEGTEVINYKGKDIVYLDYRGLKKPEEFKEKVTATIKRTKFYNEHNTKNLLVLTDLTGSFIFGDAPKYLKESTKLGKPFVMKSAVIGITGAKKIILNIINSFSGYQTKAFSSAEEAKDWLVS